jgi:hypothetical protein
LGGLADAWLGGEGESLPRRDLAASALGAAAALVAWFVAQRMLPTPTAKEKPVKGE